jgi:DNA-binding PadR family transcriptional regulator
MNRREALTTIAAAPMVAKLDRLSEDDLAMLEVAEYLEQQKDGRAWPPKSPTAEQILSLAERGYMQEPDHPHSDGNWYYTVTDKGRTAVREARAAAAA